MFVVSTNATDNIFLPPIVTFISNLIQFFLSVFSFSCELCPKQKMCLKKGSAGLLDICLWECTRKSGVLASWTGRSFRKIISLIKDSVEFLVGWWWIKPRPVKLLKQSFENFVAKTEVRKFTAGIMHITLFMYIVTVFFVFVLEPFKCCQLHTEKNMEN